MAVDPKLIPSIPLRTKRRRDLFVLILLALRGSVLRDFHPRRRRGIPAVVFSLSRKAASDGDWESQAS